MKYYDQHLHTYLSFDSDEQFENYLNYQPEYFVATDHFDLNNPGNHFHDDIPDYDGLLKKMQSFKDSSTTLLKGIEIGVVPGQEQQILDYLAQHPYELKLISIHQNGQFDYMDDVVLQKDKFAIAKMYFEQMIAVLEKFPQGDVLTHFDYGLRRLDFTPIELATFEKELERIFKLAVSRQLAFELNAKSFGRYQNAALYRYAIPLYQSVGGKLFTLGSDAHRAQDYQLLFPEMAALLREFAVEKLVVIQGDARFYADLPE